MNISKKISPQGKSLLRLLQATPAERLPEGQRHPASLYAISLSQTLRRLEDVIEALQAYTLSVQLDAQDHADQDLAASSTALIKQMARHITDCRAILAHYCGPDSAVCRELEQSMAAFAPARLLQAQHLHENLGQLRPLSFKADTAVVSGFLIEAPDEQGRPGPSPAIHQGRNTAFSYNLYLRRLFLEITLLNTKLHDLLKRNAGLREGSTGPSENQELIKLAELLARLPTYVFPDEIRSNLPHIFTKAEGTALTAIITMPSLKKPQLPPTPCTITVSYAGEDQERYRIPYMGNGNAA